VHFLLNLQENNPVVETSIKKLNYVRSISSIFDKCSILLYTIWPSNHTSHTKVYFNEFVANALQDKIESKKISLHPQKKINEAIFSFKYQKIRVRVNYIITRNQRNQTQLQKVNDFDFSFFIKMPPHLEF
jgi:hypothetical protein